MTTLTALVLSLAPFGAPRAYPIPPVPLRRLVAEAEFIVTAQVRKAEDREKAAVEGETPYCPMFVALDIEQILKGRPYRRQGKSRASAWQNSSPNHAASRRGPLHSAESGPVARPSPGSFTSGRDRLVGRSRLLLQAADPLKLPLPFGAYRTSHGGRRAARGAAACRLTPRRSAQNIGVA